MSYLSTRIFPSNDFKISSDISWINNFESVLQLIPSNLFLCLSTQSLIIEFTFDEYVLKSSLLLIASFILSIETFKL